MAEQRPVILILGSGPNVVQAQDWPKAWFDEILVINNAWRVRDDWDRLVFPWDFPRDRQPEHLGAGQVTVEEDAFVPAQNTYGGFVFAGATMAFTCAYWALAALRPRTLAFMGCDMTYATTGATHFYGKGAPDPLRADVTLRDLGAKSARLGLIAAAQGCACVNLSQDPSALLFERARPKDIADVVPCAVDVAHVARLRAREADLGYATPDGRYDVSGAGMDIAALDTLDADWRTALVAAQQAKNA